MMKHNPLGDPKPDTGLCQAGRVNPLPDPDDLGKCTAADVKLSLANEYKQRVKEPQNDLESHFQRHKHD